MNNQSANSQWQSGLLAVLFGMMLFAIICMALFIRNEPRRHAAAESAVLSRQEAAVAQARKDGAEKAVQAAVQAEKTKLAALAAEKKELQFKLDLLKSEKEIEKASFAAAKSEIEAKLAAAEKEMTVWREQETSRLQAQAAKKEKLRLAIEARQLMMEAKTRQLDFGSGVVMELLRCPAGSFKMGSPGDEAERSPDETQHEVTLTRPFWMGRFEVTQAQWMALMAKNLSTIKGPDLPIDTVSWHEATAFCQKLTEQERLGGRLQLDYEYRLPTEAEWEYACRAGSPAAYAGTGNPDDMAWHEGNSNKKPHPVGGKQPNAWGFYDMSGNVWEWCSDWEKEYPAAPATDPRGSPTGANRVIRGGSWFNPASACRAAARDGNFPSYRVGIIGFRIVLAPLIQIKP